MKKKSLNSYDGTSDLILDERNLIPDPNQQFHRWYQEAIRAKIAEHDAMAFSTVDRNGQPSCRMVLLKNYNAEGLTFFTNYESIKARHLEMNPQAALTFYWKEQQRQIRIEGKVKKLPGRISTAYFNTRPLDSRINAIISPQSQVIPDRVFLDVRRETLIAGLDGKQPSRPKHWGGYYLVPSMFEFWQGRPNRLHDRFRFLKTGQTWKYIRLAP